MLTLEQAVTIQILHQQGKSIKAISRELGVSRNTVRKYLRQNTTPQYQRIQPRISILDPYKPYLLQRVNAAHPEWIPAVVCSTRKCQGWDIHGKIRILREYLATLNQLLNRNRSFVLKPNLANKCKWISPRFDVATRL